MTIQDITSFLETVAPLFLQESYDNVGLITGHPNWNCTGIITTLDATEAVVNEAIKNNCNLIVAHHPIIFSGLKKINGKNYVEKTIITAIKNDIAIYAIHTNLDNVLHGVNKMIADKLGLINQQILQPKTELGINIGCGIMGHLPQPIGETALLQNLKEKFNLQVIKHTALNNKMVTKIALCGGAGSFLISAAIQAGADFYLSSDIKYHEFFDANNQIVIADIGHYESEQFTCSLLFDILREKFPTFAVLKTGVKTNPVHYFL